VNDAARSALARATRAEAAGAVDEAASAYDELVAADPDATGAWSVRGQFFERQRRFAEAVDSFRRSTSIKPTYLDHHNAGNMLHALGRHHEAFTEYEAAIAIDTKQAEAWCNRGIALFALGRTDEARTSFDRAIGLDDRCCNAHRCKAVLLQKLGDKGAITARRRVAELEPSAAAFIDLANALRHGLSHQVMWEPGGIEDQIVDAVERALELPCDDRQRVWSWAEKCVRLQRIAHGRQAAHRSGLPIEDGPAIVRYLEAAEAAGLLFPEDLWFAEKLGDAQLLHASLPR